MVVVSSAIETVKVHRVGATVFRRIELAAENGKLPEEIEVPGLPLALADPSVRIRVLGVAVAESVGTGAELVAADIRVGLFVPPRPNPEIDPDQAKRKDLERSIRLREAALDHLALELDLIGRIGVPDRPSGEEGKPPPASPMAARLALEEFIDEGAKQRTDKAREIRDELDKLREDWRVLMERIERTSSARYATIHEVTKTVVAKLRSTGSSFSSAQLVLEYFVPGARWAPAYQCRLSRDCREARIELKAIVWQRSGEDWKGVRLQLSTALPMTWHELPEMPAIKIGRAQAEPAKKRGFRPPPVGSATLFADHDRSQKRTLALFQQPAAWERPALSVEPLRVLDPTNGAGAGSGAGETSGRATHNVLSGLHGAGAGGAMADMASISASLIVENFDDELKEEEPGYELSDDDSSEDLKVAIPRRLAKVMAPPAPATRSVSAAKRRGAGKDGRPQRRTERLPDESMTVAHPVLAEALVYTQLWLGKAAAVQGRNRLRPADLRTQYLETLARHGVELKGDPFDAVDRAYFAADQCGERRLPEGLFDLSSLSSQFDFAYSADAPVDVPSDGELHSVPLGSRVAESDVRYVAVPREDTNVYRVASLKNPIAAPLLPGPAEIHVGGEYVLTTQIPTVVPQGEFQLGLGVEQAIKCARNCTFREQRSGDKVVATSELWHELNIELANNLGRDVTCEVRERIPQPAPNAEVVVEEGEVSPAWERYRQEERRAIVQGGRRWQVKVAAHARATLKASYVVKIYANNELAGGNRREV